MKRDSLFKEFKHIGKMLFTMHLVGSHSGNMSMKIKDNIIITRHNAMLGALKESDIVVIESASPLSLFT